MWMFNSYLVGGFNPSKEYESVGVTTPNIWKKNIHVPNHQSVFDVLSNPKIPNMFPVHNLHTFGSSQLSTCGPSLGYGQDTQKKTEHTSANTIRVPLESI